MEKEAFTQFEWSANQLAKRAFELACENKMWDEDTAENKVLVSQAFVGRLHWHISRIYRELPFIDVSASEKEKVEQQLANCIIDIMDFAVCRDLNVTEAIIERLKNG